MVQASGSIEICTRHLLKSLATAIAQIGKGAAPPKRAFNAPGQHALETWGTASVSNFNLIIICVAVFATLAGIRSVPVDQIRLPVIVLSCITGFRIFILWFLLLPHGRFGRSVTPRVSFGHQSRMYFRAAQRFLSVNISRIFVTFFHCGQSVHV
mgnify:CR=1 FL=1